MLKGILLSALLLAVPACATQDAQIGTPPDLPGKVVIIGDSISLGYGAMGANTDCPLTPEFNSISHSYGVQIAEALGADYVMFASPGIGLVRNYGDDQTNTMSMRMKRRDQIERLDSTGPVQLVLINLGTHDFYKNDPSDQFIPAMENLLSQMSTLYPDATIYALTGPMLGGNDRIFHAHAVETAVDAVNAEKGTAIRYLALNGGDRSIALGCGWHPSVPAHEHMAEMILDDLRAHNQ
ncbi:SGNH/GDSL hydrolase family protein [Hyphomonas sp.]|uniref:SGNH/GDSL hydrolase family protein n=1 Tax=Hyphomonas sp. TaxID=87 RepID=UPI003528E1AD